MPEQIPEGGHATAFPFIHPSPDGASFLYHLGLSKLEVFTLFAMHASIVRYGDLYNTRRAIDCAIAQIKAIESAEADSRTD